MEIKKEIEKIVNKIKNDKDFAKLFKSSPIAAVKKVVGDYIPEEKIDEVVSAVKTKIKLDDSKIVDKLKGLLK